MKTLIALITMLFLSGCASLSDYEQGCRDGLEITQIKSATRDAYCEALQKTRKTEKERR